MAGCGGTHTRRLYDEVRTLTQTEIEARLVDVSLPIGTTIQRTDMDNGSYGLRGRVALQSHDVIDFFTKEMERSGWDQTAAFHGVVLHTYVFEKPHKLCTICVEAVQESPAMSSLVLSYISR